MCQQFRGNWAKFEVVNDVYLLMIKEEIYDEKMISVIIHSHILYCTVASVVFVLFVLQKKDIFIFVGTFTPG